jgi:hypothetical protein
MNLEDSKKLYEDLRKLAVEKNIHIVTATQPRPKGRRIPFRQLPKFKGDLKGKLITIDYIEKLK